MMLFVRNRPKFIDQTFKLQYEYAEMRFEISSRRELNNDRLFLTNLCHVK